MALISFSRATAPVASITFANNPSVKRYGGIEDYYQIVTKTGDVYTYDYGLNSTQVINLSWNAISYDNFIQILNFYETVKKSMYSFTFTDFNSDTSSARFISALNFVYIKSDLLSCSFDILIDEDRDY